MTKPNEPTDQALVNACLKGDHGAFAVLVRRYQRAMLNTAWRLLGDYEEACETVQDAFVAAWRNLAGFRQEARFSTWLTSITLNQARSRGELLRTRQRREGKSLDEPQPTTAGTRQLDPPATTPSVQDQLEAEAVRQQVRECIAALPPDFREVLVLRDMEELSYDEVGATLNIQAGTVKSRLFRAREGMRECLKRAMGTL
jgi:RNA polymerase sigma-70 factor (ECF subfamily)